MTPQVDFYLLNRHIPDGRLRAVCRLSHKIYALGKTAFIRAADADQAKALDDLMWTFDQSSFVPHGVNSESTSVTDFPVVIGYDPSPPHHDYNVLISLSNKIPEYFSRYHRVVEFVDNTEQDKAQARDRFRQYRDQGCALQTHEIQV